MKFGDKIVIENLRTTTLTVYVNGVPYRTTCPYCHEYKDVFSGTVQYCPECKKWFKLIPSLAGE